MNKKIFPLFIIGSILVTTLVVFGVLSLVQKRSQNQQTETVAIRPIGSDIVAQGTIHSQEEATLHFQTGGKLIYLPFQVGDTVSQNQTIASLDTYTLQQQLTQALNNYRSTRDTFDQTQANAQTGALQNAQKSALNPVNQAGLGGDQQFSAINDAVKRIVDQNQASLDNSVINVQIAQDALQLATLTAPFSGIISAEDVTVANQFITPATAFSLANPTLLVFRANVEATDVDFIAENAPATIQIGATTIHGVVTKIYPQKVTLPTGESVYQVDIQSTNLTTPLKLGESGIAHISTAQITESATVPTWTIVDHNKIWVLKLGKPMLTTITVGKQFGSTTSISGLSEDERIIVDPSKIAAQKYPLL